MHHQSQIALVLHSFWELEEYFLIYWQIMSLVGPSLHWPWDRKSREEVEKSQSHHLRHFCSVNHCFCFQDWIYWPFATSVDMSEQEVCTCTEWEAGTAVEVHRWPFQVSSLCCSWIRRYCGIMNTMCYAWQNNVQPAIHFVCYCLSPTCLYYI